LRGKLLRIFIANQLEILGGQKFVGINEKNQDAGLTRGFKSGKVGGSFQGCLGNAF